MCRTKPQGTHRRKQEGVDTALRANRVITARHLMGHFIVRLIRHPLCPKTAKGILWKSKVIYILGLAIAALATIFAPAGVGAALVYALFPPLWVVLFAPTVLIYLLAIGPTVFAPKQKKTPGKAGVSPTGRCI